MRSTAELEELPLAAFRREAAAGEALSVRALCQGEETEVLDFLGARPLHTVYMAGFILDNGLVSPLNRGTFYGCQNSSGELLGVSLIGHVTQIETRTPEALGALARAAQGCPSAHVIMGEQEKMRAFWSCYGEAGQAMRLACRELLLEQCWPVEADEESPDLRLATLAELERVLPVQAEMAVAECGINPLHVDPVGFRERYARRIGRGRVWVSIKDGELAFKADIMAETPQAVYLEGIYVNPLERGKGYGRRCLRQLGRRLLSSSRSICLLVNEKNSEAHSFYYRAGYKLRAYYETIYLQKQ
jgi:ribosomal protein S18 acetylase RimI-like enzyme